MNNNLSIDRNGLVVESSGLLRSNRSVCNLYISNFRKYHNTITYNRRRYSFDIEFGSSIKDIPELKKYDIAPKFFYLSRVTGVDFLSNNTIKAVEVDKSIIAFVIDLSLVNSFFDISPKINASNIDGGVCDIIYSEVLLPFIRRNSSLKITKLSDALVPNMSFSEKEEALKDLISSVDSMYFKRDDFIKGAFGDSSIYKEMYDALERYASNCKLEFYLEDKIKIGKTVFPETLLPFCVVDFDKDKVSWVNSTYINSYKKRSNHEYATVKYFYNDTVDVARRSEIPFSLIRYKVVEG